MMKTTYDYVGAGASAATDAWPGMHELVGGDTWTTLEDRSGGELRWRPLPAEHLRFIPWWTRDLTAAKAQEHLWVWTEKLGKADGTLYVMWREVPLAKTPSIYDVALLWAPDDIEAINGVRPPWAMP